MTKKKKQNVFVEGPISPAFIAENITSHSTKLDIGGHAIFLGQVRGDVYHEQKVKAIEYSCYRAMADKKMYEIREYAFARFEIACMHIYHSLGKVKAGDICVFVFVSSRHRKASMDACREIIERIKTEVPIWGKEIFEDESYKWKNNS